MIAVEWLDLPFDAFLIAAAIGWLGCLASHRGLVIRGRPLVSATDEVSPQEISATQSESNPTVAGDDNGGSGGGER